MNLVYSFYDLLSEGTTSTMDLFVSLYVNLYIFFILQVFGAEKFQGFRLNFIDQNARTLVDGVDKRHVIECFEESEGRLDYFKFES